MGKGSRNLVTIETEKGRIEQFKFVLVQKYSHMSEILCTQKGSFALHDFIVSRYKHRNIGSSFQWIYNYEKDFLFIIIIYREKIQVETILIPSCSSSNSFL